MPAVFKKVSVYLEEYHLGDYLTNFSKNFSKCERLTEALTSPSGFKRREVNPEQPDLFENGENKMPDQKSSDQQRRFIEAAREAECSEDEAVFDETLRQIAKAKPAKSGRRTKRSGKGAN